MLWNRSRTRPVTWRKTIKEPHKQGRPLKRQSNLKKREPKRKEMLKRLTRKKTRRLLSQKITLLPKRNLIKLRRGKRNRGRGRKLAKRKAKEDLKSLSTGRKKVRHRLLTISWRRHRLLQQRLHLNLALYSNVKLAIRFMQSLKN